MNKQFQNCILKACAATQLFEIEEIQSLWSGYGKIVRYGLQGGKQHSVVVKHVRLPDQSRHPRGWNTDISHQRKIKSYQVEMAWYADYSQLCDQNCRVPACLALEAQGDEVLIVLEDLQQAGFPEVLLSVSERQVKICLAWLANFHATFMGQQTDGLWPVGTYWHLDTRPDELEALSDLPLKNAAALIDQQLRNCAYQTLVHGDAKLANFCFSKAGDTVAAVDFQYVGGGCGMKDVAYFLGSCMDESSCQRYEEELLDFYFATLKQALIAHHSRFNGDDVEQNWRPLYATAWTDFHRFLKGWSPGHWKINGYSESLARQVLSQLQQTGA